MKEYEKTWLSGFTRLPAVIDARLQLIAHLERREGVPSDVIRGARERVGADLVEMFAAGLADQWAAEALGRVGEMRAGKFRPGDPVEFGHPTKPVIEGEGTYESESNDVVHIRIDGRGPPQAVTAALVKAVPESCARAKQFAELCQAARGRSS